MQIDLSSQFTISRVGVRVVILSQMKQTGWDLGPVSEVGLEIKQLTRIKQSQIKQPWQSVLMLYLRLLYSSELLYL